MGFPRQEYWSGLLFPTPGDLPNPGIEPTSLASPALADGFCRTGPPGTHTVRLKLAIISSMLPVKVQSTPELTIYLQCSIEVLMHVSLA